MAIDNDDRAEAVVALVSGALIGVAVALFIMRMRRNKAGGSTTDDDDYYYDGGDLFV